jgi:hypothetical protein
MSEDGARDLIGDCHEMLLRLAGRLPDDLMTQCREQLAAGELGEVARAIVFSVLSQYLPLSSADVAALTAVLSETGGDASALREVEVDDSDPVTWYFTEAGPVDGWHDAEAGPDGAQDALTVEAPEQGTGQGGLDQGALGEAMAAALAQEPDANGCWRAWRVPGEDDEPPAAAKCVFVVEMRSGADLARVAGRLQQRLAAAGETSPQVEVYHNDEDLPVYQRLARGCGGLIWAAANDPGMLVAVIFDEVDPQDGPRFSADHPRLNDEEVDQVAQYLREGEPVLVTTALMDDVVDTTRQGCVPLNFRTDGLWIWTDASAYYAVEYQLEPDPGLLAHIRSNHHTVPAVDGVSLHRALAVLMELPDEEPAWTFGGAPDDEPAWVHENPPDEEPALAYSDPPAWEPEWTTSEPADREPR